MGEESPPLVTLSGSFVAEKKREHRGRPLVVPAVTPPHICHETLIFTNETLDVKNVVCKLLIQFLARTVHN